MARPSVGTITESGSAPSRRWRVRFRANGRRRSRTFHEVDGWTRAKVEQERSELAALGRRGLLHQEEAEEKERPAPTLSDLASQWWEAKSGRYAASTQSDYQWRFNNHLGPAFGAMRVDQITVDEIDAYTAAKVEEASLRAAAIRAGDPLRDPNGRVLRPLSPQSINKTLDLLTVLLDFADERGLIVRNPMHVNRRQRRLRPAKAQRTYLDSADRIQATLDAAGSLDEERSGGNFRRAVLATLIFGGLRIGELTALRWKSVDLANSRISILDSKTAAGIRDVTLLPALSEELTQWKFSSPRTAPDDFVFGTRNGTKNSTGNLRNRVVSESFQRASEAQVAKGGVPLPEGLTPHSLRRTCASLLVAIGRDVGTVMDHLGHATEAMTLTVYRQRMKWSTEEIERLERLVSGGTSDMGAGAEIDG